jgi:glycosyltransferase involved in cell wall biosynthesis
MNCLIVVQNYPPEIGAVRYTYNLAQVLNRSGKKVTVITGIPHYPTGKKYPGFEVKKTVVKIEEGIEVIRTPLLCASNSQPKKRIVGFITFFFSALPHIVKKRNTDLMIVSIPPITTLFLGIIGKAFFRIPFVALLRDVEPYYSFQTRGLSNNKFICFIADLLFKLYKIADYIVLVFANQLNSLCKFGIPTENADVIPHPPELSNFDFNGQGRINNASQPSNNKLIGIYLGTFGKCHSLPDLIKNLVSDQISNLPIEFLFVGYGEDHQECQQLVKTSQNNNVKILDLVPFNKVPSVLQKSDFLIFSFNPNINYETPGAKLNEYLASGKPILVLGTNPAADKINELKNGWHIRTNKVVDLYNCMNEILEQKSELSTIGRRGKTYLIESRQAELFNKKWNQVCKFIVNEHSS